MSDTADDATDAVTDAADGFIGNVVNPGTAAVQDGASDAASLVDPFGRVGSVTDALGSTAGSAAAAPGQIAGSVSESVSDELGGFTESINDQLGGFASNVERQVGNLQESVGQLVTTVANTQEPTQDIPDGGGGASGPSRGLVAAGSVAAAGLAYAAYRRFS